MTEAEWLRWADPGRMLSHLHGRRLPIDQERFRLFALACCRRIWHLLPPGSRGAVECLERCAREGRQELVKARRLHAGDRNVASQAMTAAAEADLTTRLNAWARNLAGSVVWTASRAAPSKAAMAYREAAMAVGALEKAAALVPRQPEPPPDWRAVSAAELAAQCDLLRDVFGNPFRPVAFDPGWRAPTAVALARQMDDADPDERDYAAMPILADALQDAGCDSADLLGHLRGPGRHVLGCWALDLILGAP
jgi:hypothetical protein